MSVYLIRVGEGGPVKLGRAADPLQRLAELQTAHHEQLTLLRVIKGDEREERAFRRRFHDDHIRGEWFRFNSAMLVEGETDKLKSPQVKEDREPHVPMTGADLKAWRMKHGLTQRQLADALGMSVSRIIDYERGAARGSDRQAKIPRVVELALLGLEVSSGNWLDCFTSSSKPA